MQTKLSRLTSFTEAFRLWLLPFWVTLARSRLPCMPQVYGLRFPITIRLIFIICFPLQRCFSLLTRLSSCQSLTLLAFFRVKECIIAFSFVFTYKNAFSFRLHSTFFHTFWVSHWFFLTYFREGFLFYRQQETWWCFWTTFKFFTVRFWVYPWIRVFILVFFRLWWDVQRRYPGFRETLVFLFEIHSVWFVYTHFPATYQRLHCEFKATWFHTKVWQPKAMQIISALFISF